MAIIKLSATERRRLSVFVTCLAIAIVAWILVALSNSYKYTTREIVNFKNAPQKRAFHSLQSDTVDVTMLGTGWQMLLSEFKPVKQVVNIDLHTLETKNFIVLSAQLKQVNEVRDATSQIIAINPDTLYFDFTNRATRHLPVKLQMAVSYQQRFALSGQIIIKPAFVTVSGPANRLDKLTGWPTDSLILPNLNQDYSGRLKLKPVNDGSIMIYPKAVEINIPVDEYTEKTLDIPVKLINHNYENVKIFPQKVKVTFTVSLNKYPVTDEAQFEASADLALWRDKGYTSLPIKFTRLPAFSKIVDIEPRNLDFIVKK